MKELWFDLRTNWVLLTIKSSILVLAGLVVFNTVAFSQSTDAAINRSFSDSADVDLYSVTDSLSDPDAFARYRESTTGVDTVSAFYNALNHRTDITFLSAFDQSLPVENFRGDPSFEYGAGTEIQEQGEYLDSDTQKLVRNVKSLQLNQATFDFYHLAVASGTLPDWDAIDYQTGTIPVVLGHSYSGIYEVGDTISANFYFQPFRLQVVGVLEPNSSMYYKGDMNTFLDDYILLPYPPSLDPTTKDNLFFQGILSFAMIGGDIAAPHTLPSRDVLNVLAEIGSRTGFNEYILLNLPDYLVQFELMRNMIAENGALILALSALVFTIAVLLLLAIGTAILRRRIQRFRILWIIGHSEQTIGKNHRNTQLIELAIPLICLIPATALFPHWNLSSLVGAVLTVMIGSLIYSAWCGTVLHRTLHRATD